MKSFFKWVVILIVLFPLALILLTGILLKIVPQERFRAMAAVQMERRIHRQVEIGPIHLGLSGLNIEALKLSEVPNFKAGLLFNAINIQLGWNLRELWEGLHIKTKSITRSSGRFHIDDFENPHYLAHDFSVRWSLTDIDPTGNHLNGWVTLNQGKGLLLNVDQLMDTSRSAKIALTPVLALMNLERMGFLKLGLPDLKHWPIHGIQGEYRFKNGRMTIEKFMIDSTPLSMNTTGTVDLPSSQLLLDIQLHLPQTITIGAMDAKLRVSGTLSHPKVDLDSLKKKMFQATLNNLLQNPQDAKSEINQTLKNLFH